MNTTGGSFTSNLPAKPNVCPGCGRCKECGQPVPALAPVYPWPVYPWPYTLTPYGPVWISPPTCAGTTGPITGTFTTGPAPVVNTSVYSTVQVQ
jgi:hypothetical protein